MVSANAVVVEARIPCFSCGECQEAKKTILKNRFGIEWNSPVDLNPMVIFD